MPKKTLTKSENQIVNRIYATLATIVAVVLLVISGLAWWGYSFSTSMVRNELSAQKIYFPEAGSPELDPAIYPNLQKYAGQLVDNGAKARAYANEFIGQHLKQSSGGRTYAEVSNELQADPDNQELARLRQSLFMGETLRGILLGTGYAFGTIGQIAKIASIVALLGAVITGGLAIKFRRQAKT